MLYKITKDTITLLDSISFKETIVPIKEPLQGRAWRLTLNNDASKIAILRGRNKTPKYDLVLIDIKSGEKKTINISSDFLDFQWLDSNSFIYSNGNNLFKYDLKTNHSTLLCKFNRIRYSPISMTISPDNTKVAFLKYKGDNAKLCIFNLEKNKLLEFKNSVLDYSWSGNNTIIFRYLKGAKILDIESGKVKTFCTGIKAILKKNKNTKDEKIEELDKLLALDSTLVQNIGDITVYKNRYFFNIMVIGDFKRIALISVLDDLSNLKFHFWSDQGFFNYHLFNNQDIIGIDLISNPLTKEIVEEGWHYLVNGEFNSKLKVELDEFHLVSTNQRMT